MTPLVLFLSLVLGATAAVRATATQATGEHVGRLKPDLLPSGEGASHRLRPATEGERSRVPQTAGSIVMIGVLEERWLPRPLPVALVELASGRPTMYADVNHDGRWTRDEALTRREPQNPSAPRTSVDRVLLHLPLPKSSAWRLLPMVVTVRWPDTGGRSDAPDSVVLSTGVAVEGTVAVGGRDVLVRYGGNIDVATGRIDPTRGVVEMDLDGSGYINYGNFSLEVERPEGTSPVFRVGGLYLATKTAHADHRHVLCGAASRRAEPPSPVEFGGVESRLAAVVQT